MWWFRVLVCSRWIWCGLKIFEWWVSTFCFGLWIFPFSYSWFQPSHFRFQFYQLSVSIFPFLGLTFVIFVKGSNWEFELPPKANYTHPGEKLGCVFFLLQDSFGIILPYTKPEGNSTFACKTLERDDFGRFLKNKN